MLEPALKYLSAENNPFAGPPALIRTGPVVAVVVNDQLNGAASGVPSPRALIAVVAVTVYVFETSSGASGITVAVNVALLYATAAAAWDPSCRLRISVEAFNVKASIARQNEIAGLAEVAMSIEPSAGLELVTVGPATRIVHV